LTAKQVSICNLDCSYCFFPDKEDLYEGSRFPMSDEILDRYSRRLIVAHSLPVITVAERGVAPTLMGLDFVRRVIETQENYRRPGMTFENSIQSYGTLLTDEWCEFLKSSNFLIRISIGGPESLHDVHRVTNMGIGTSHTVMRRLRLLQGYEVEYNVLTMENSVNGDFPLEVYRFPRDEARTTWIKFIPVVDGVDDSVRAAECNGPFPCGPGKKTKRCHSARQPTAHGYREMAGGPGWPRPRARDRHEQQGEASWRTVRTF
jgi:uncharacterized protein